MFLLGRIFVSKFLLSINIQLYDKKEILFVCLRKCYVLLHVLLNHSIGIVKKELNKKYVIARVNFIKFHGKK